jgi:ABC-type Fe3+-citrate transport system substrate-binding protein
MKRKLEAIRDRIMLNVGTSESWHVEDMAHMMGDLAVATHFRRPLRIDEINQMAPTVEVRRREGRP